MTKLNKLKRLNFNSMDSELLDVFANLRSINCNNKSYVSLITKFITIREGAQKF